jgi:hypothetical protein
MSRILQTRLVEFSGLRDDWFANGTTMARSLQRDLAARSSASLYRGFPRQWIPIFEWVGAKWEGSTEPTGYVPFFSGRSEADVLEEVRRARAAGELRLLVEIAASSEVVLCETLQQIDERRVGRRILHGPKRIRLTNWHSYNRAEVLRFERQPERFRQANPTVLFIPCARKRPYQLSQTHRKLLARVRSAGINPERCDKIVVTSIGLIPEPLWGESFVQRYDTGVRDIYRLIVQARRLLRGTSYDFAWDLLPFSPYSDLLQIVSREGLIPTPRRLPGARRRNIPAYRA